MICKPINEKGLHEEAASFINDTLLNLKLILQDKEPFESFSINTLFKWLILRQSILFCWNNENHPDAVVFFDRLIGDVYKFVVYSQNAVEQLRTVFSAERLTKAEQEYDNLLKCKTRILFH